MSERLLSYSSISEPLPHGLAWAKSVPCSTDVLVGLCVGGAVVPVRLRFDYAWICRSERAFIDEVERCIDSERAMLVGSF